MTVFAAERSPLYLRTICPALKSPPSILSHLLVCSSAGSERQAQGTLSVLPLLICSCVQVQVYALPLDMSVLAASYTLGRLSEVYVSAPAHLTPSHSRPAFIASTNWYD